ncbi:MAG: TatD family hydrolase [Opitutaceae bacterium]|nr:TatD family hydrolase [Verrucomicrobiales bacterium]
MPIFFDTHAHLDFPELLADIPGIVDRARSAGIEKIISIGTSLDSSAQAIRLAGQHEMIFATVGWHPGEALEAPGDIRPQLAELARHPKVVAIGETGLDYFRLPSGHGGTPEDDARYKAKQAALFQQQLEVAAEAGLNCVIHQRGDCFPDTMALMRPYFRRLKGVFHCFVGNPEQMREIVANGSLVSFTGILTFKNGQGIRETLSVTPVDRFMLETDSPFLAPVPHRGKRCEPAYVKEIADVAAATRGMALEELSRQTCLTAAGFFRNLV